VKRIALMKRSQWLSARAPVTSDIIVDLLLHLLEMELARYKY
jgi:hypothetical protein